MLRSYRRPSVALWLVLYATLTLCGPGLHALSGGRHGRAPDAGPRAAGGPHEDGASAVSPGAHDGDDCPVCSYLAQGQIAPPMGRAVSADRISFLEAPRSRSPRPSDRPLRSHPRAPPRSGSARI